MLLSSITLKTARNLVCDEVVLCWNNFGQFVNKITHVNGMSFIYFDSLDSLVSQNAAEKAKTDFCNRIHNLMCESSN